MCGVMCRSNYALQPGGKEGRRDLRDNNGSGSHGRPPADIGLTTGNKKETGGGRV